MKLEKISSISCICAFGLILLQSQAFCQNPAKDSWATFTQTFSEEFTDLSFGGLSLSYLINLEQIPSKEVLEKQQAFIHKVSKKLQSFDPTPFSRVQQLEYHLLNYQLVLHQERIQLEKKWKKHAQISISPEGLAYIPMGKDWYTHFLHRWVDLDVDPDSLYVFGAQQVARAKQAMKDIQVESGLAEEAFQLSLSHDRFFYQSAEEVEAAFLQYQEDVSSILPAYFPYLEKVSTIKIKQGTDPNLARVPGFYRNNTFFYNYFDKPFNNRQIGWLYLHEAVPGHHYERSLRATLGQTDLQNLFWMPCYSEGWAAYIEEIAVSIHAYRDVYEEYGKWEWDLIRSVRVMLDVGLNYYGWEDTKAMEVWKSHISNLDEIGEREIARMKKWPAQVITYKYGADWFLQQSQQFGELKSFHQSLMDVGPLPFSILKELIQL
ncbi:MAG: DUF885 family protein [Bacteroidota bacterium]